ncbi:MAG: methylenetetrahydrofolate reductase [NAD(P)H] [Nitrospinae bacterium]|nr:methylenetetrahydrofolate reductase [NAD(P)H] [Nitrospinota bacterium]
MKIIDLLNRSAAPLFSFEFFPPKDEDGMAALYRTISDLKELNPSFVSVTYGAGGSTREKTLDLVIRIKHEIGLEPMSHLTCVGSTGSFIREILERIQADGIENVLALRGDPPKGETGFQKPDGGFGYAYELVWEIKKNHDNFCIGVAGYPEKHPESPTLEEDIRYLKLKVDSGADFIVTQLFFNNNAFFEFLERAEKSGIHVPIIPGIMPITNFNQIRKFTEICGAAMPKKLVEDLEKIKNNPEDVQKYGTEYAINQCRELLDKGVKGIHFYTLNKSKATMEIFREIA